LSAPAARRRRPHKAGGGRIVATGFGAGALLGIVGAIGASSPPASGTSAPPPVRRAAPLDATTATTRPRPAPATPTTIVWHTVHRVIVVDDPPAGAPAAAPRRYAPTRSYPSAPAAPAPAPQPAPAPVVVAPAPAPAAPACSGSKCP
jgi:hypothetical protein